MSELPENIADNIRSFGDLNIVYNLSNENNRLRKTNLHDVPKA